MPLDYLHHWIMLYIMQSTAICHAGAAAAQNAQTHEVFMCDSYRTRATWAHVSVAQAQRFYHRHFFCCVTL